MMESTTVITPHASAGSAHPEDLASAVADLLACGSLEMSAQRAADARELAALLPTGTRVYVNHLPGHDLAESLPALQTLHEAGLEPVPHVAARSIKSKEEAASFLQAAVRRAGVSKVLLIGGDPPAPVGPYADSVDLLRDSVLAAAGVREIGIAGYPEGHPRIPRAALERAFRDKLELATTQGLGVHVITQFSFAPARVVEYCAELSRAAPSIPVYVGVTGPADPAALLRFAQRCGVSASLRALRAQGMGLVRAVTHTDPSEQLVPIARYCAARASCNVVGSHLFSFGAAVKAAKWIATALAAGTAQAK